jgi:hypothetical protein
MYYHFRPDNWYWIMVILSRKLLIAITALLFNKNPGFQMSFALLVLFICYALQVCVQPSARMFCPHALLSAFLSLYTYVYMCVFHPRSLSLSLSHTHSPALALSLSFSLSLSLSLAFLRSLSLTHTHIHTHACGSPLL